MKCFPLNSLLVLYVHLLLCTIMHMCCSIQGGHFLIVKLFFQCCKEHKPVENKKCIDDVYITVFIVSVFRNSSLIHVLPLKFI